MDANKKAWGTTPTPKKKAYTLRGRLRQILDEHKGQAARMNKVVGYETQQKREEVIFNGFDTLKILGYHLHEPGNFKPKHMEALAKYWEAKGLAPATIQVRISIFRVFSEWIGKKGMLGESIAFVEDPNSVKRHYAAQRDKTWIGNGVNFVGVVDSVAAYDKYVAVYLWLGRTFGMRRQECYMFRPHLADKGSYLVITEGTKGERSRVVAVATNEERRVLDMAKALARTPSAHIGIPGRTKKQMERRFNHVMEKCGITKKGLGVTFHGLRHERLNEFMEGQTGTPTPIRRKERTKIDKAILKKAQILTAEYAGHSRPHIITAYCGSYSQRPNDKASSPRSHRLERAGISPAEMKSSTRPFNWY